MSGNLKAAFGRVSRAVRVALIGVAMAMTAMAGPAFASAGCTYINSGGLNHTVRFVSGSVSSTGTTARYRNTAATFNSMQTVANYSDPSFGVAGFSGGPYALSPGDVIRFRVAATGSSNLPATVTTSIAGGSGVISTTGNGAQTLNYTATGSESQLGLYTYRQENSLSANLELTATCTAAPAPSLTSITPNAGSVAGGTSVTLSGTGMAAGETSVTIGGVTIPASSLIASSATSLTFVAPAHAAGNVDVTATSPNGTSSPVSGGFTYVSAPTADNQNVSVGYQMATALTLTGSNATSYAVTTTPMNGTLSGTAPNLTYTPNSGFSGADSFNFRAINSVGSSTATITINVAGPPPTITSISPVSGSTAGNSQVQINGTNLFGTTVTFDGVAGTNQAVMTSNMMFIRTPAHAAGAVNVVVTGAGGSATLANGYTYILSTPPTVTANPPNRTVVEGNTTTFPATAVGTPTPTVQWQYSTDGGGSWQDATDPGATTTTLTVQATYAKNGYRYRAVFTNDAGITNTNAGVLTVIQQLAVTGLSPNSGVSSGGGAMVITGTGFQLVEGVTVGGNSVSYTVNSPTQITINSIPAGTGSVRVQVSTVLGGSNPDTPANLYTYLSAPSLTSASPSVGPMAGGTAVTLNGTNFIAGATSVTIDGMTIPAGSVTVNSTTSLTFITPAHAAGNVAVTVTTAGGTSASVSGGFTYAAPAPTVSSVSPAEGAAGATPPANVTISGSNFSASGNTVTFGGIAGSIVSESATSLVVTPPANATGGQVNVVVTNASSQSGTRTNGYRYLLPPTVTVNWSPDTISGNQTTTFTLVVTNPNSVAINNVSVASNGGNTPFSLSAFGTFCGGAGSYNANSTFSLSAINLAAGASCTVTTTQVASAAGAFQFVTSAPISTGTAATVVTLTGAPATSNTITVHKIPSVFTVAPSSGPLEGGRTITISGANFSAITNVTVDGIAATNVTVVNTGTITATTPAGASGGLKSVAVTNSAGTATRANAYQYLTPPPAPGITTPTDGGAAPALPIYTGTTTTGGLGTVTVYVDGASLGTVATASNGSWTLTQPTALAAGSHTVYATVSSPQGGTSARSATTTFTVDTVAPAAPVIASHTEGEFRATRDAYIAGTAEPGSRINVAGSYPIIASADANGDWSYLATAVSTDGPVSISVTATDSAGNVSSATTRSWIVDTAAPAVPVVTTPSEGQVVNQRNISVQGTIEPFAHVNILLDGQAVAGFRTDASGAFSYSIPNVADGSHTLSARASDRANNQSAYSTGRTFTVDATAPAFPVLTSPAPGTQVSNASPNIEGTAEADALITVYLDDFFLGQATATGGVWSIPVTATLSDGAHSVKMMALDAAFNSSGLSAPDYFTVDATAPSAPVITSPSNGALLNNGGFTVEGSAEPNTTVFISVDGEVASTPISNNAGNWGALVILVDGPHTLSAVSSDPAGNDSPASPTITITVDSTAPAQPTITSPTQNQSVNIARPTLTGTAESGSTVTLTINGVDFTTTADAGVWSYTPTTDLPAGQNIVFARAIDAAGNPSPQALVSFNYVPISIDTTTLVVGQVGVEYAETIAVSGGSSPYTFDRISGNLPLGVDLDRNTGVFSGTPQESGSFPFGIMVEDDNGILVTQDFTLTIDAPAAPAADPETVQVPATATGSPATIDLSGSVANAASIEIVTPPAQGSVTVTGLSVVYTPAPGFFGTVTFQYKAIGFSDGNGAGAESAPATVTVTIAAPTLALSDGALPDGQVAQDYSQPVTATGGTAPYTYAVTGGALPTGLTLATDGTLSGSATAGGVFNFDITATDASTGTGPFSITGAYSLTIAAPTMSVTPATVPAATVAQAYSTTFTASGGVGPYGYAVTEGALPAGLSLTPDGALSGTPTAGGTFTFTVTATDSATGAGPYTASQAITLTVNGSTIAVTPTALADGTRGVSYSQSVSATGGVAPYTYALASGDLPAGLTLSPQGVIAGTPTATGAFTFDVRATDSATGSGPYQGVTTVSLTISAAAITVTPTSLPEILAGTPFSQQMQATGGQGGYTYALFGPGLPTGVTLTTAGLLNGRAQISGVFNFTVTARDGFGNTGSVALQLTVNGRPDPSADADVRGLSAAQANAARRMADTQIDNFSRRLEALHTASGQSSVDVNLNLNGGAFTPLDQSQVVNVELAQATGRHGLAADGRDLGGRSELASLMDARRPDAPVGPASAQGPANGSVSSGGLRVWAGGAISLGERDAVSQTAEMRIHTSGVSAGVDMRVTDTLDLGVGAGYGQERTEVGDADSRLDADSWVGVAYGSWRPAESIFFDGMLGYGQMSFDTQRRALADNSLVTGDRESSTWFGSVSAGVDRSFGPTRWIGYGRVQTQSAELDAYAETGSPTWALDYDARQLDSLQGVLGVRYQRAFEQRDYSLTPGVRVEWRREFSEGGVQTLRYADWLEGPAYAIGQDGWGRSEMNLGLTLDWKAASGWSFSSGADGRFSDDEWLASLKLTLSKTF